MVLKLVVGAGTSGVLPKLSYIVSLCGGLESPQPIEVSWFIQELILEWYLL